MSSERLELLNQRGYAGEVGHLQVGAVELAFAPTLEDPQTVAMTFSS